MADLWGNIVDNQPAMKGDIQENKRDMGADIPANLVIGIPGKSAYQYALEAGYTGTEAEFAEALSQIGNEPIDEDAVIRIVEACLAEHPPDIKISPATTETLGGIIVGENLEVAEDGTIRVDTAGEVLESDHRPVTSQAVHEQFETIVALLKTI